VATINAECRSCGGTGLYQGFAETNSNLRLPFQNDQDYQDGLIAAIRSILPNVSIDVTLLRDYGQIGVDTDENGICALGQLFTGFHPVVDRMMGSTSRIII
jgi:hypothetical protein